MIDSIIKAAVILVVHITRVPQAFVRLDGELWQALSDQPLAPNDRVTVDAIEGVVLRVSRDGGGK